MRAVLTVCLVGAASALRVSGPQTTTAQRTSAHVRTGPALLSSADAVPDDECYLFDSEDGRKFVCTTNPEELAWFMGLEMKDLKKGAKPADLELIECSEDWSHNGTPQWVCKEEKEEVADEAGCEVIGETADEVWFACADSTSGGDGVECSEEDFGVGGGPGILPQDGEVLCKQKKPTAAEVK